MNFCSNCGSHVQQAVPEGDHKLRYVCSNCGTVHYDNPRMIVGCLPRWKDRVLLCKRSNDPKRGFWTLPAGFMENNEAIEAGAMRETREEAHAEVEIIRLFSVYSVPVVSQVYLFFLANLKNLDFHPGTETETTALFSESEIPWQELAFSSVKFTLEHYFADDKASSERVFVGCYQ